MAGALVVKPQLGFQEAFCSTPADIAIGGGAAGCGKSWSLVYDALRWAHVPGFEAILFRRTSPELRGAGSIWDESMRLCPLRKGRPRGSPLSWTFPSGARIAFSHMQYLQDAYSHRSKQYAGIYFDELTLFEEDQFWYMLSRNRSTCGVTPYIRAGTNPDPDSWVTKMIEWWINQETGLPIWERSGVVRWFARMDDNVVWGDNPAALVAEHGCSYKDILSFTFIPGKLSDNPKMLEADPRYETRLRAMPLVDRERLLNGNWLIRPSAGMYFKRQWLPIVDARPAQVALRVRAWDKAGTAVAEGASDKVGPAWTVGVLMSRALDGVIYVEDVVRFRGGPHEVEKTMAATARLDGRETEVWMWQDPGQAGKADVDNLIRNALQGFAAHAEPAREDKETYAKPLSAQAEAGNVRVVRGPWNSAYVNELEGFPTARFKDQVDASALGFRRVCKAFPIADIRLDLGFGLREGWGLSNVGPDGGAPHLSGNE